MEYPSNSYASKQETAPEDKKLTPVVQHDVKTKPRSLLQKFADMFGTKDFESVKDYAIKSWLIPGLKKGFISILNTWLNDDGYSSKGGRNVTTVSYKDYYDQRNSVAEPKRNDYLDYDDIIFTDRGDAEYVLDQMVDLLKRYRVVRVSDMFELSKQSSPYTGMRYGWTDLTGARVIPIRGGFVIKMPRAIPIDRN